MLIARISGCKGNAFLCSCKTLLVFISLIDSLFKGYFKFMLALMRYPIKIA